jgi:hypothetical protein
MVTNRWLKIPWDYECVRSRVRVVVAVGVKGVDE